MDHLGQIEGFIADVDASQNLEEVFAALRQHMERLGFERFTYELMWTGDARRRPLFITSFPDDWIGRYIEKKYAGDDLVARFAAQIIRPFMWSEAKRRPNLTKPQRLVFSEAKEIGLQSGGTVPITGPERPRRIFPSPATRRTKSSSRFSPSDGMSYISSLPTRMRRS